MEIAANETASELIGASTLAARLRSASCFVRGRINSQCRIDRAIAQERGEHGSDADEEVEQTLSAGHVRDEHQRQQSGACDTAQRAVGATDISLERRLD